jgi:hypothetical protein
MAAINVFANHNIVVIAIADDNFCRRRNDACKNSANGRAQNDHSHFSLLCFPRDQGTLEVCNGFKENLF